MKNYSDFSYRGIAESNFLSPFVGQSEGSVYDKCDASLYSSIFPPDAPPPHFSVTPNTTSPPIVADYGSQQSLDFAPFQDLIDRRNWCLSNLRLTAKEAESLRQENVNLQMANSELNRQLSLLQQQEASASSLQNYANVISLPSMNSITDCFGGLRIGDKGSTAGEGRVSRVVENVDPIKKSEVERVKLPKSISVRSNGYLKTVPIGDDTDGRVRASDRVKTPSDTQKVYVVGGKKEEEPLELQVYNQGMSKTELCNKWQQTGACPYGDHCQFAHGIEELRPVIRHPRYKTEVCRMILAGDPCPYGHRCHFRHALSEEEKLMRRRINRRRSFHI